MTIGNHLRPDYWAIYPIGGYKMGKAIMGLG